METSFLRKVGALELEEKILSGGSILAIIGIFLPWLQEQESYTQAISQTYNGLQNITSFLGTALLLSHVFLLAVTFTPLTIKKSLLPKPWRGVTRLNVASVCVILTFAVLSVDLNLTFSSPGSQIRYGIYVSLIGSLLALLYGFILWQEEKKQHNHTFFQHPEERIQPAEPQEPSFTPPPAPPTPPPPPIEEHPLYRN